MHIAQNTICGKGRHKFKEEDVGSGFDGDILPLLDVTAQAIDFLRLAFSSANKYLGLTYM